MKYIENFHENLESKESGYITLEGDITQTKTNLAYVKGNSKNKPLIMSTGLCSSWNDIEIFTNYVRSTDK